ncbi:benzoate/H(+) symporter BenE family transporter [Rhodobacteraceae bacterium 2CG4]|uniref:Benzoate/H(+) symporter BenE family transporter n=1 Tax=Halovulum marinum TaxID=2662447 RepID=A0A6L5Z3Q5_9RHOB|nr:benzoate/H(+) symporter BenE family transporter [Halovulum marinum]MSU91203.1 benzoate/H(+) symporter BenE family transporter [Halovulum marinum]
MFRDFSASAAFMGVIAAFVGFASSFAVVLQGLDAVGATAAQAASGLMAIAVAKGVAAIAMSARTRIPIAFAWSTPGAALLVTTGALPGGFAEAVGAFVMCSALLVLTGLWKPLAGLVGRIPAPLANAMLAGVLLGLCLAPFRAIEFNPAWGLPILAGWILGRRLHPLLAVPAALAAFVAVILLGVRPDAAALRGLPLLTGPVLVAPVFTAGAFVGLALPLYIVTMAGQNLPGAAVLRAHGYDRAAGPDIAASGFASVLAAPFGGHAANYAAITAALCVGAEAHPDPARRYWAAIVAGLCYVALGLLAGAATAFVGLAPQILIQAVGGVALFGAFSAAALAAFRDAEDREASAVTFLLTASGAAFLGVSGAFWGLLAGGAMLAIRRRLSPVSSASPAPADVAPRPRGTG